MEKEQEAKPIRCEVVCIHFAECFPFVSPVLCTKIELWDDIANSVEHAGYYKLPISTPTHKGGEVNCSKCNKEISAATSPSENWKYYCADCGLEEALKEIKASNEYYGFKEDMNEEGLSNKI